MADVIVPKSCEAESVVLPSPVGSDEIRGYCKVTLQRLFFTITVDKCKEKGGAVFLMLSEVVEKC